MVPQRAAQTCEVGYVPLERSVITGSLQNDLKGKMFILKTRSVEQQIEKHLCYLTGSRHNLLKCTEIKIQNSGE